ncbi:hypothetical protein INR49_009250, partial [Caranx melampygus]
YKRANGTEQQTFHIRFDNKHFPPRCRIPPSWNNNDSHVKLRKEKEKVGAVDYDTQIKGAFTACRSMKVGTCNLSRRAAAAAGPDRLPAATGRDESEYARSLEKLAEKPSGK